MAESEPLLTAGEVPITNALSKLAVQNREDVDQSFPTRRTISANMTVPTLPEEILDLIFASLCPPAPSTWIHGTVADSTGNTRHAPSQPPDTIWSKDWNGVEGNGYPVNTLLLGSGAATGDTDNGGEQNPGYVEYKLAMRTLAAVARTCSWVRDLVERYLYRYVVLVRGRQLAGFVAALEGRFDGGLCEEGSSSTRLGRYVWGMYCFVDMTREEDLNEWYTFEKQLEEWNRGRLRSVESDSGLVGKEGEEEKKKKKKKKKKKERKGKENEKAGSVSDTMPGVRKEGDKEDEDDDNQTASTPEDVTKPSNHTGTPGMSSISKTTKASNSAARRNRRKKTQNTDVLIKPLDEMGTFFRLHSAMLDKDLFERRTGEPMSFSPRNLYNLFLRLFLAPSGTLLPNLTDLLCSWVIIKRVSGIVKEPDYLSNWIPGRVTLHPRPCALHKIKTFTLRSPVSHPDTIHTWRAEFHDDIRPTLGDILDALPNLETFDTVLLSSCRGWGRWIQRPLLEANETYDEQNVRLCKPPARTHPLKHIRAYRTYCSPANLAVFLRSLLPGSLETLLVRFRHLSHHALECHPGTALLGHDVLVDDAIKDSLRYLELVSTPSRHYLTRTRDMALNPRLRRLTCLPYLDKLRDLVVDFQGLFGDIRFPERRFSDGHGLDWQDIEILSMGECLPPNLETLKVICVWSSGSENWYYSSAPVGKYMVSGEDVTTFVVGLWGSHRDGLLRCCKTLRRVVLVVPDRLTRISESGVLWRRDEETEEGKARERRSIAEAGRYFEEKGVEFVVERGMDVLDSAEGT
ncbi:hypothetical protein V8F20_006171 [Naviculisporaceae sp. PSN 640]